MKPVPFRRSARHQEQRRRLKQAVTSNNLIPCLLFLAYTLGPTIVERLGSLTGLDTQSMQAPMVTRPYGMTPSMWRGQGLAYKEAGLALKRPSQTIGAARASVGTHAKDGVLRECVESACGNYDYSAAVDLSVRGYSSAQIRTLIERLAERGYIAWYRRTGSFANNKHIHMVYVGVKMKGQLQSQARDGLHDRTGLVGHARETFYNLTPTQKNTLRALFLKANPV